MPEEQGEKAFGSMQEVWNARRTWGKSVWVNAGGLECPKNRGKKRLGKCKRSGMPKEHGENAFESMQEVWSD